MSNPHKGEIAISADGKKYKWCFSANAISVLEEHLDRGIFDIAEELRSWSPPLDDRSQPKPETAAEIKARNARVRFGFCRSVFWAGFQDAHPDMTVQLAGDIMMKNGGLIGGLALIMQGMMLAFPQSGEGEGDAGANPPNRAARRKAKAVGTGSRS
jgi:hypothetical protein